MVAVVMVWLKPQIRGDAFHLRFVRPAMKRVHSASRKLAVPKRKRLNCLRNPFRALPSDAFGKIADYVYYGAGPVQLAYMLVALGSDPRCEDAVTYYSVRISNRLAWSTEGAGATLHRRRVVRDSLLRRLQSVSVARCLYCGKKDQGRKNAIIECGDAIGKRLGRPRDAAACRRCWIAQHVDQLVDTEDSKCACAPNPAAFLRTEYCERCIPNTVYVSTFDRNHRLTCKDEAARAMRRFRLVVGAFGIDFDVKPGHLDISDEYYTYAALRNGLRSIADEDCDEGDAASVIRAFLRRVRVSTHLASSPVYAEAVEGILARWTEHARQKFGVTA